MNLRKGRDHFKNISCEPLPNNQLTDEVLQQRKNVGKAKSF